MACFAPLRRLSHRLLQRLQSAYLQQQGGYCEVAVPTINAITNGTFNTATQTCMVYTYRNPNATLRYDAFRSAAAAAVAHTDGQVSQEGQWLQALEYLDREEPCLLHPVKPRRRVPAATSIAPKWT